MTDYKSQPSSDIRQYIWDNIVEAGILNDYDYYADGLADPLMPIIPAQQVPEFNNLLPGKTYMLYDFEVKAIPVQWWMIDESFTLTVISQNYEVINQITSLVQDLFRRFDESGVSLNVYLQGGSVFNYHHTSIESIFSPEPFGEEGDYQVGSVIIFYSYSRNTGADGRF